MPTASRTELLSEIWEEHPRNNQIRCKICHSVGTPYSWIMRCDRAKHENSATHKGLFGQLLRRHAGKFQEKFSIATVQDNDDDMEVDGCSDLKAQRKSSCDSLASLRCERGSDLDFSREDWDFELDSDTLSDGGDYPNLHFDSEEQRKAYEKAVESVRNGMDEGDPLQSPAFVEMLRAKGLC